MPLTIRVTNQPTDTDANVEQPLLELLRVYAGQKCVPFHHQAEVFRLIAEGQEVFLVAGTAAGKTLAIAVPLSEKLRTGCIRKVLFIYVPDHCLDGGPPPGDGFFGPDHRPGNRPTAGRLLAQRVDGSAEQAGHPGNP